MNSMLIKGLVAASALGLAVQASAYEVTIYDGEGVAYEDGETEPGMANSQVWDLEGVFLENKNLSMVGGFDYQNGVAGFPTYTSGDIFLSVGNTPVYGNGAVKATNGFDHVANSFGYNYVLDMDYSNNSYQLLAIDAQTTVSTAYLASNHGSSPFQYVSGGTYVEGGNFSISTATDAQTGFTGGNHFVLGGLDLSTLLDSAANGTRFYSHFTMGCGNDNLMGSWEVPEPATIALLSMGLFGLWFSRRKQSASFNA